MLTCLRTIGYLSAACVRVVVAVLVGAAVGLSLAPLAVSATLHYIDGSALGSDLPCCPAQVRTVDYLTALHEAARHLQSLPERLSELE
ncbi:MAG: hypothetical protein ACJ72A_04330 [Nocardioidaceae bacterium]